MTGTDVNAHTAKATGLGNRVRGPMRRQMPEISSTYRQPRFPFRGAHRGAKISNRRDPGLIFGRPAGVSLGSVSAAATNRLPLVGSTDIVRALTAVWIGAR